MALGTSSGRTEEQPGEANMRSIEEVLNDIDLHGVDYLVPQIIVDALPFFHLTYCELKTCSNHWTKIPAPKVWEIGRCRRDDRHEPCLLIHYAEKIRRWTSR